MENWISIGIGILFIVMSYFMIVHKKIQLLHAYHYKRVKEQDKNKVSVLSGIGLCVTGIGMVIVPFVGEQWGMGITLVGIVEILIVITYFNKGLF